MVNMLSMKRIDIFPDKYASRITYGGRINRQTLTGACSRYFS